LFGGSSRFLPIFRPTLWLRKANYEMYVDIMIV
jgi:hypothetical protein